MIDVATFHCRMGNNASRLYPILLRLGSNQEIEGCGRDIPADYSFERALCYGFGKLELNLTSKKGPLFKLLTF